MAVARRGDAADPEQGAEGAHSPAVRSNECGQPVSRDDEHDADGDPRYALGEESVALPSTHDREASCTHGRRDCE
ncbi:hypothetical protein F4827_007129 [Paraburkholderia bannensis]|uniref:Uncharacterized protein n=1 Tax=Paraburkholderia bannensis TaxID=765414 RepID=A0A7W9WX19_9BURK|nr:MULTISPECIES: hypothetical protein [Paraburkholderia]MBB3262218.1 hypothetical protein [Paraburkholderia sp. WP4_3_2]MBB6107246.1 hypothetical protein [Paraburkholderia bannensis]